MGLIWDYGFAPLKSCDLTRREAPGRSVSQLQQVKKQVCDSRHSEQLPLFPQDQFMPLKPSNTAKQSRKVCWLIFRAIGFRKH